MIDFVKSILRQFSCAIDKFTQSCRKSKFDLSENARKVFKGNLAMQAGDIVKLKNNFEEELSKLGFCSHHAHAVSTGFKSGLLKIGYIRHEHELDIDFAVFSPFFEVPVQCFELASGKDIIKDFRMMKQNNYPAQYPSGKARVYNTQIHQFKSDLRL